MRISSLQTQNRNRVNLEELHALSSAYGKKMQSKEIILMVGFPALLLGTFVCLLTYYWFTVIPAVVLGAIYGYRIILPKIVKRRYESQSLLARNKFMNSMTQVMSDPNRTVNQSIDYVLSRTNGELHKELKELLTSLAVGSDPERVTELIYQFGKKYQEDNLFNQFLEQLETTIHEGKTNIEAMQDLTEHHNDMLQKRNDFFKLKDQHLGGVKLLSIIIVGLILMLHMTSYMMSGGMEMYMSGFAHNIIGHICVSIFIPSYLYVLHGFINNYFDDSVMEVQVKTKK